MDFMWSAGNRAKEILATVVDLPYEAAFFFPVWEEFYCLMMDYARMLYILFAMCTGYLLARMGMRHVPLPLYIVGVTCHAAYGWLIMVSNVCINSSKLFSHYGLSCLPK